MFGRSGKRETHPSGAHWRRWEDSDRGMRDQSFDRLVDKGRSYSTRAQEDRSYDSRESYQSRRGDWDDRDYGFRDYGRRNEDRRYEDRGYSDQDYSEQGYRSRSRDSGREAPYMTSDHDRGSFRDQSPYRDWEQNRSGRRSQIASDYLSEGVIQTPLEYNRGFAQFQRAHEEREASHYGKGPKGYKRSDERIHEEVCEILTHDAHIDASDIEVKVEDGTVILTGTVESRRAKRRAEECAEACRGVHDVRNELKVKKSEDWGGFTKDRDSTVGSDQLQ